MPRVFVTGGTGFVGGNVGRALLAHGFLVRCVVTDPARFYRDFGITGESLAAGLRRVFSAA